MNTYSAAMWNLRSAFVESNLENGVSENQSGEIDLFLRITDRHAVMSRVEQAGYRVVHPDTYIPVNGTTYETLQSAINAALRDEVQQLRFAHECEAQGEIQDEMRGDIDYRAERAYDNYQAESAAEEWDDQS